MAQVLVDPKVAIFFIEIVYYLLFLSLKHHVGAAPTSPVWKTGILTAVLMVHNVGSLPTHFGYLVAKVMLNLRAGGGTRTHSLRFTRPLRRHCATPAYANYCSLFFLCFCLEAAAALRFAMLAASFLSESLCNLLASAAARIDSSLATATA